jgi:hypothetical protein
MTWFYESNGQQKGPVSEGEFEHLIAQGVVLPTTLVWRDGLANWTPLAQARPAAAPAPDSPPPPGMTRCEACGRFFDPGEIVQISGRNICAGCKPGVLQALQQGVPVTFSDSARQGPPWEERETIGWAKSAWQTIVGVLTRPSETFAKMRVDGGITAPFLFQLLVGGSCVAVRVIYFAIAERLGYSMKSFMPGQQFLVSEVGGWWVVLFQIVGAFLGTAAFSFVYAGVFHLCLMLVGGARRPYETTYRVICYGGAAVASLNLIPILGTLVSSPWTAVAWMIGLARAHETDLWRAIMAVMIPFVVCCFGMAALVVMVMGLVSGNLR